MWGVIVAAAVASSALTPRGEAAEEMRRRIECRNSLLRFTEETHPSWQTGRHHGIMCQWLERLESRQIRRLAIFAPPRHGKTELVGRRFPAWYMGRHPERQIIYGTHTSEIAANTGADVRDIIMREEYKLIFPSVVLRDDARASERFANTMGGIQISAGVGKAIAGRGAHLAILDDLHGGRNQADSPRERDIVHNWYSGDVIQRLMRPESLLLMFTRWNLDDLAGRVLPDPDTWEPIEGEPFAYQAGPKWVALRFPAILNEGTDREEALWPGVSDPDDDAELLAGYPLEYLQDLRAEMRSQNKTRDWTAQYQQNPIVEEGLFIQRAWLEQRFPEQPETSNVYIAWDGAVTSASSSADPDRTEIGVFALPSDGKIYVLDWWSGRETMDVWIDALLDKIKRYEPLAVFGEKGVIQRASEPYLARRSRDRNIYARFEWLPTTADKLARGRSFQAMAASGRFVFPRSAPWVQELIDEVSVVPSGRYWDKFDTFSTFCGALDQMHPAVSLVTSPPPRKRDRWVHHNRPDHGGKRWMAV